MQSNFWAGSKKFGPAQNILGPVKGQGISFCTGTKLFGGALKFDSIFGLAQNIWTGTKHFGSCRRTWQ